LSAANKSLKPALTFVERMRNVMTSQETATGALTGFGYLIAMPRRATSLALRRGPMTRHVAVDCEGGRPPL